MTLSLRSQQIRSITISNIYTMTLKCLKHITVISFKSPESPCIHTSKDDVYKNN